VFSSVKKVGPPGPPLFSESLSQLEFYLVKSLRDTEFGYRILSPCQITINDCKNHTKELNKREKGDGLNREAVLYLSSLNCSLGILLLLYLSIIEIHIITADRLYYKGYSCG